MEGDHPIVAGQPGTACRHGPDFGVLCVQRMRISEAHLGFLIREQLRTSLEIFP